MPNRYVSLYPFPTMAVGDSFTFATDWRRREQVVQAAAQYGRRNNGERFKVSRVLDGECTCERIA